MKPVILVVDDEEDLLQVLTDAVVHALPDYEVAGVGSLPEAEEVLDDLDATGTRLALVLADHQLGPHDGLDLLGSIQQRHPSVPRLLFTGRAPNAIEDRAAQLGARVIWKPIRLQALLKEVAALL